MRIHEARTFLQTLPSLGWTAEGEEPTGDLEPPVGPAFSKGDLSVSVNIDSTDAGGWDVTVVIYSPQDQAAAATPAMTATPGVQPTLDESEIGLPEDIPIYPGATIRGATPGRVTF